MPKLEMRGRAACSPHGPHSIALTTLSTDGSIKFNTDRPMSSSGARGGTSYGAGGHVPPPQISMQWARIDLYPQFPTVCAPPRFQYLVPPLSGAAKRT